jgi:uncharacterized protein with HEPN domain
LLHILNAIKHIETFSAGRSKQDLFNDFIYRFAIERQLEIIGEAANNLSDAIHQLYPFVPWSQIISFRNLLAHEYFGIDLEIVWAILEQKIPMLKTDIRKIVENYNSEVWQYSQEITIRYYVN